jgi:hypothetical protein
MTTSNFSDTSFAIQSNVERYFWAAYLTFGILSSVIGDTLILMASFHKNAFKINTLIVTILQHIAVCDLVTSITTALPTLISLLTNTWVLGDVLCYTRVYIYYLVYPASMLLVTVLTTGKLMILRFPLRAARWTKKNAHQICCVLWIFGSINPIVKLTVDKNDVMFDYRDYCCTYEYTASLWGKILPLKGLIYLIVPNVVIVVTTIPTLRYISEARRSARRAEGRVPIQGAWTVALTALFSCISTLPLTLYLITMSFVKEHSFGQLHVNAYRICGFLRLINVMSNFYIYALTIESFRRFVLAKFLSFLLIFGKKKTSIPSTNATV